jgi:hypothetical protein
MKRYRAKPIEIEALLWQGDLSDVPQEWTDYIVTYDTDTGVLFTRTLQGPAAAEPGEHYLIPNLDEYEVYPVVASVFHRRYEAVPE